MSQRILKKVKTCALIAGVLQVCAFSAIAAPGELATQPLTFVISPQPNIMLLLDDSGSMNGERLITNEGQTLRTATVDGSGEDPPRNQAESDDEIYEICAGYNSLAYNPAVRYEPWVSVSDVTDTSYVFGNKTLTTANDNPINAVSVDISDHMYIRWDDDDNDGLLDDGECGPGLSAYDNASTTAIAMSTSGAITATTSSGIFTDSNTGFNGRYSPNESGTFTILVAGQGINDGELTITLDAFNLDNSDSTGDGKQDDFLEVYPGPDADSDSVFTAVLNKFGGSVYSPLPDNVVLDDSTVVNSSNEQINVIKIRGGQAHFRFSSDNNGFQRDGFRILWSHSSSSGSSTADGVLTGEECDAEHCVNVASLPADTQDPSYNVLTHGNNTQQNYANWYTYHRSRDFVAKNALANLIQISDHRVGLATANDRGDGGEIVKDMSEQSSSYVAGTGVHADKDTLLKRLYQANTLTNKQLKDESGNIIVNPVGNNTGTPLRRLLNNTGLYFQQGQTPGGTYLGYDITNSTLRTASHAAEVVGNGDTSLQVLDEFTPQFTQAYGGQCQQNFALLVTDGAWNGALDISEQPGNTDADDTSEGAIYDGGNYADTYSNTLADVAMKYFETDLSDEVADPTDGLEDRLSVSLHGQTIEHQHMVTFGIGFGVTGTITADPETTSVTWTDPITTEGEERIDDLLHAAYNGRGGYFSATDSDSLQTSLDAIIQEINVRTENSATGVSFSSYQLSDGTLRYDVSYRTESWWGDIEAYKFENNAFSSTAEWSADAILSAKTDDERKARKVITFNGQKGVIFQAPADHDNLNANTEISATQRDDLLSLTGGLLGTTDEANYLGNIINYLKGDSANEGTQFRSRSSHYLGALIHSQPQYVAAPEEPYPFDIEGDTDATSYSVFADSYKYRRPVVYVGGNDGMLHAFYASNDYLDDSGSAASDTKGGEELFAYIPHLVSEENRGGRKLSTTANTLYQNTPYVDGDIIVSDVFVDKKDDNTERWRSYLVGALRAGGRGIYALDVTNPDDSSDSIHPNLSDATGTDVADDIVVREFTHDDLGYIYGSPIVAKMNNGRWAAIVPSGYWSTGATDTITGDGTAKLFIVYLDAKGAAAANASDSYTMISASENTFPVTGCSPSTVTKCSLFEHRYVRATYLKNGSSTETNTKGQVLSEDFFCSTDTFGTIAGYTLQGCYTSEVDVNGLSAPTVVDLDNDGDADRVYAGDLHGNMWVFNLQSSNQDEWAVDDNSLISNDPLFVACRGTVDTITNQCAESDRQPIMVAPLIVSHPEQRSSLDTANTIVLFGTGQYVTEADQQDNSSQSIYGVWDAGKTRRVIQRTDLVTQTLQNVNAQGVAVSTADEAVGRTGGNVNVSYTNAEPGTNSAVFGWHIDLPATDTNEYRERSIISPIAISDIMVFATFIPTEGQCNASSGVSFLNAVRIESGQETDVLDKASTDGTISFSGFKVDGAIVGIDHLKNDSGEDKIGVSTDAKENFIFDTSNFSRKAPVGRQSWSILR